MKQRVAPCVRLPTMHRKVIIDQGMEAYHQPQGHLWATPPREPIRAQIGKSEIRITLNGDFSTTRIWGERP